MQTFKGNGKLLITGEYAVLDGALSLAIPTKFGQTLCVEKSENQGVIWKSFTNENKIWFEQKLFENHNNPIAKTLEKILSEAQKLNPNFSWEGTSVSTFLDFPLNWGLGSSSTLIYSVACWARVSPYQLLFNSLSGSGYDVACAGSSSPLLYWVNGQNPKVYPIDFQPSFADKMFFVHLNKKQKSSEGIQKYRKISRSKNKLAEQITEITENILRNPSFDDFCKLIAQHEEIISNYLKIPKVKDLYFADFQGEIKSLGAWGGDFILALASENYARSYFQKKGYSTIFSFDEMIFKAE